MSFVSMCKKYVALAILFLPAFNGSLAAQTPGEQALKDSLYVITLTATPDTVCQGASSQLSAEAGGGTPPYTYQWIPSAGLSDPTIANPVATPDLTTEYVVTVTDAALAVVTDSVVITVLTAPDNPGPIIGPSVACKDSLANYFINPVSGANSYSWTAPAGATIVSGQNTPSIQVLWGITGGTISVIAGNECGNSTPGVLDVTLTVLPETPGPILGNSTGCLYGLVQLYIDTVSGAAGYAWTVPPDAVIVAGQGTTEIFVNWGAMSGDVSVSAENFCGSSPPSVKYLVTDSVPSTPEAISGPDTVCVNHNGYIFSIPAIPNADEYVWSIPAGANIASGQGTPVLTLDFTQDAVTGNISVYGANDCGLGFPVSFEVFVSQCAGIPGQPETFTVDLYPNPVRNILTIAFPHYENELDLKIYDLTGRLMLQETLPDVRANSTRQVDVSAFRKGLYFLRLANGSSRCTARFVIGD